MKEIKKLQAQYQEYKHHIRNEEQTKTSLVLPFFQSLGWSVSNPLEFVPEFTADIGVKKREKVDYAIVVNRKPVILIEVKSLNEPLENHISQLYRYFGSTLESKFAILTNGRYYQFFSDLDYANVMDTEPFFCWDMETGTEADFKYLQQFSKSNFDEKEMYQKARHHKIKTKAKTFIRQSFNPANEALVHLFSSYMGKEKINELMYDEYKQCLSECFVELLGNSEHIKSQQTNHIDLEYSIFTVKDTNQFIGKKPKAVAYYGRVCEVASWSELVTWILNEVIVHNQFEQVVENPKLYHNLCPHLRKKNQRALRRPIRLSNGIQIEMNLGTKSLLQRLKMIAQTLHEDIQFSINKEEK